MFSHASMVSFISYMGYSVIPGMRDNAMLMSIRSLAFFSFRTEWEPRKRTIPTMIAIVVTVAMRVMVCSRVSGMVCMCLVPEAVQVRGNPS